MFLLLKNKYLLGYFEGFVVQSIRDFNNLRNFEVALEYVDPRLKAREDYSYLKVNIFTD